MKLSKQQLKTSTRHYIKKCAGAVCTSKLHESARNSKWLHKFKVNGRAILKSPFTRADTACSNI